MPETLFETLLRLTPGRPGPSQSALYAFAAFDLPGARDGLAITLACESAGRVQLPLAVFDPAGRVRYAKASEPAAGRVRCTARIGTGPAEPGAIPGTVEAGRWRVVLHKRILGEALDLRITVEAGAPAAQRGGGYALDGLRFADAVVDPRPGWYCGELHLHSNESTGRTPVEVIRDVAVDRGLDFLALTDHYAASHWLRIDELGAADKRPLFLRSLEIPGDRGHANAHGIAEWIDPFVDDADGALSAFLGTKGERSMAAAASRAHLAGGLFCVNHALSGGVAWRYEGFPMEQADLIEIACLADGPTSFLYPTLWDRYLCTGLHVTGVGSSDSHDPLHEGPWGLGQIRTWVYASSLSRGGILEGLRRGRAYVAVGGSRLEVAVHRDNGGTFAMGDTVPLSPGERCRLTASLREHSSGNLFVIRDGLIHQIVHLAGGAGPDTVGVELAAGAAGAASYVRLEFHEDLEKARFHGMAYRDHWTMRLLSNPVWLAAR
jgi:hypothetical protein